MGRSFVRLSRVLQLEAQQGYKNKAVVGGIRQFAVYWVGQAREEAVDEADRAFVEQTAEVLNDYANLSGPSARSGVVDRLLEKLAERDMRVQKLKPVPPPPPPPEPTPPPRKAAPPPPPEPRPRPTRSRPKKQPVTAVEPDPEGLRQSTTELRGVGAKTAERLEILGAETLGDLLYVFPRRYDDYTQMKPINRLQYGENVTIIGTVWEIKARRARNNTTVVQATITDGSGKIQANWYNQKWLLNKLKAGYRIVLSGTVDQYLGRQVFNAPEWDLLSMDALRTGQIVPIYPLTQGLSNHKMRQIMKKVVPDWAPRVPDPLPDDVRRRQAVVALPQALMDIHLPDSQEALTAAKRRIAFDELFLLQLGMQGQRRDWQALATRPLQTDGRRMNAFIESLPFTMTGAQQRVVHEITKDMERDEPMNRLLQGDVGAGKTVVAAAAMVKAVAAGTQSALMAPTEILAEQHYQGLKELLEPLEIEVVLLTGKLGTADKRDAYAALESGAAAVAIGTHALIQEDVAFANLGLAVIDEQHRFGVDQRAALREKGPVPDDGDEPLTPHLLVMSATPIPRSLALSLYGDLDLSVLDEMPPGRQEIRTHWIRPRERERCYAFVRGQVEKGRQAYIICPLVEESDKIEAVAAVEEYERLSTEIFPDLKLGLVHGRLKSAEKETVMRDFYAGDLDILVSTSVIEVGVDVPNSTVMVIEGANRFGLAQLHQFRGRVGRGAHQSFCLLIADETTPEAEQRLRALEQTNDGFELAEKDLELRGPGEFFGRRQSGLPELMMASLTNMELLQAARDEAVRIIDADPYLERPEHAALQERVQKFWENAADVS